MSARKSLAGTIPLECLLRGISFRGHGDDRPLAYVATNNHVSQSDYVNRA